MWFEATNIKGARRVKTLPTLLESTALEWFLAEKTKTPEGVENAKTWEEVKEMLLVRFVPKHQHFLDGIALIHLKQGGGKGSLKNYAWEFQAKMVSCKEVNEYSKLVIFYAGLDEGTKQKYFERKHVLESLDEALALADILLVESSGSGVSHEPGWKGKASISGKQKHEKSKNFKRKFEEGEHKSKMEASRSGDKKKSRHDNDTCYNYQEKGHLAKDCTKPAKP